MTRHTLDPVSLVSGVVFVLIGLVLVVGDAAALSLEWLIPGVAIALGILMIWTGRSRRATES